MEPAGRIEPAPGWMRTPATRAVIDALTARGQVVRFCGGCVRDAVLGRDHADLDIATPDPPETVIRLIEEAGLKAVPTGIDHGTVTAIADKRPYEITTLRRDVESFGRKARVAFTDDWLADAARRDFTINALYADPDGTLYDPFGGRADLVAGRVRFVGDAAQRIREDVLRILRFFRFHQRFGTGEADPDALAACRSLASLLPTLSGERVRAELFRILTGSAPERAVSLMHEAGVMAQTLPEATSTDALGRLAEREADEHMAANPIRRLAVLIPADADIARRVAQRLKLSNADAERLAALAQPRSRIDPEAGRPQRRRLLYEEGALIVGDLVLIAWAERPPSEAKAAAAGFRAWLADAETWQKPELPVKGADVLALGAAQGKAVGAILAEVEGWWIDGDFKAGREACLAELKRRIEARAAGSPIR